MNFVMRRCTQLFVLLATVGWSLAAQAGYDFTIIPPNSLFGELFGINNSGHVVGAALLDDGSSHSFVYDLKNGTLTDLPSLAGAFIAPIGVNEPGTVAGIATDEVTFSESGFILDKKGKFTVFSYPGLDNTESRAIDNAGRVSGYAFQNDFSDFTGFIYDPERDNFIDIRIPNSVFVVAQGINNRGDVVGSVNLVADGACTGCPASQYGFLRSSSGTITLFQVNGVGNRTRARGITDSGRITGDFRDPSDLAHGPGAQGFVTNLVADGGFHLLHITAADLVNFPGAAETTPEGIDNSGRIVGIVTDADGTFRGFVATPTNE